MSALRRTRRGPAATGRSAAPPGTVAADDRMSPPRLWIAGGLLLLLWIVALSALTRVFVWGSWWPSAVGIIGATIAAACAVRAGRPKRGALAGMTGFAAGLGVWAALLVTSGRAVDWWIEPAAVFEQVQVRIVGGSAPLVVSGPLTELLLATVLLVAGATTLLLVLTESPLLAGALVALVLLVPAAVTGVSIGITAWSASLLMLGLLAWVGSGSPRWHGIGAGLLAGALAVGAMAITPATQDRVWNDSLFPSPVSRTVPDVTLALAEDLQERSSAPAFSFTSSAPGPLRFTLATLAEFDGGQWQPQQELAANRADVSQERSPAQLPPTATDSAPPAPARTVTITIDGLLSSWLPLPQSTTVVHPSRDGDEFQAERWWWSAASNTAQTERDITRRGYRYTAEAAPLDAGQLPADGLASLPESATALIRDPEAGAPITPYLALPDGIPDAVSSAAADVAAGRTSRIAVGRALQDWFRSGAFSYDEAAPYQPGADPDDPYAVMTEFLETRQGFCVHYAATFAVMARELGVPTRVAVGYASRAEADETTVVLGRELHAWPEIYVDDLGWVAFEPTPGGAGALADGDGASGADPSDAPDPTSAPAEQPTDLAQPTEDAPDAPAEATAAGAETESSPAAPATLPSMLATAAGALLLLGAALSVPAARRGRRRRLRVRAMRSATAPASAAWEELRDTASDLGFDAVDGAAAPRAQTSDALLEHWERAGVLTGAPALAARRIAAAMSAERYGAGSPRGEAPSDGADVSDASDVSDVSDDADDADDADDSGRESGRRSDMERDLNATVAALRDGAGPARRARARWMPRSVLRGRLGAPASTRAAPAR